MQIIPVDEYKNLFKISNVFPYHIVEKVLFTPWMALSWQRQQGQETWLRRRINDTEEVGRDIGEYIGTGWWLDEPGFTCAMHTDGEMPGSLHMTWIAAVPELGTAFYNYKDENSLRHQFLVQANTGYIMINVPDESGTRHLQWHAMTTPVPAGTYRLSSYTWLQPK
jgi:hypothetical protein